MKKILLVLTLIFSLMAFPINSLASTGTIKISSSTSTVVVGNTVTVTVTLSSSTALGAWEFDVNYDSSYLQLTSSTAENNGTYFVNAGDGTSKSKTYTLKFRALKSGTTNITVGSYDVYGYDKSSMSITKTNKKLTLMTQAELEATYSTDNNLKSLAVEGFELDKEFDKDTLEYTVNVPTGTTSVKITATKNDSTASVSGAGEVEVTEGLNTIPIIVTAQNGTEKTYTLIVNVEDQNPINVTIDNSNYTVVKNGNLLTAPLTFTDTTILINNFEIPAFVNTNANITLVGLKDSEGNIKLYIYDDGTYLKYNEMNLKSYLLIPVSFDKELDLIKTTVTINNEIIEAYKYSEKSDFVIINAKNLEDGQTNLYLYDTQNNTASLYDESFINETNETLKNYTYVIIAFAGALFLMLILIFSLLHSLKKKQKKINKFIEKQEAKIEATRKLNDVVSSVKKEIEKEHHEIRQDTTELENKDEEQPVKNKLSKKERKKLKQEQKNQKAEPKKIEDNESKEEVEIKEIQGGNEKVTPKEAEIIQEKLEDTEEMYDLFGEDKKKKRKKK